MSRDQHTAGTPAKRRGQQTGFKVNPDQSRVEIEEAPAIRGRRNEDNRMFTDNSSHRVGLDSTKGSTNSPSTPAMNTSMKGRAGGERGFKKRLATKRSAGK